MLKSLGSGHNGVGINGEACPGEDQYVMTPVLGVTNEENFYNPFSFSTCSVQQFRKFLSNM